MALHLKEVRLDSRAKLAVVNHLMKYTKTHLFYAIIGILALLYASNILQRHLDVFVNYGSLPDEEPAPEVIIEEELIEKLKTPVSELELSVRSANCLREANIKTIYELVRRSEAEMLKYRNFGKKSLTEIGAILKDMNLGLGMKFDKETIKRLK